jgi:hypothetical protein
MIDSITIELVYAQAQYISGLQRIASQASSLANKAGRDTPHEMDLLNSSGFITSTNGFGLRA